MPNTIFLNPPPSLPNLHTQKTITIHAVAAPTPSASPPSSPGETATATIPSSNSTADSSACRSNPRKHVRRTVSLPPKSAKQMEALAKECDLSDNRVLLEIIKQGIGARQWTFNSTDH
jgi:hypothetical protein